MRKNIFLTICLFILIILHLAVIFYPYTNKVITHFLLSNKDFRDQTVSSKVDKLRTTLTAQGVSLENSKYEAYQYKTDWFTADSDFVVLIADIKTDKVTVDNLKKKFQESKIEPTFYKLCFLSDSQHNIFSDEIKNLFNLEQGCLIPHEKIYTTTMFEGENLEAYILIIDNSSFLIVLK